MTINKKEALKVATSSMMTAPTSGCQELISRLNFISPEEMKLVAKALDNVANKTYNSLRPSESPEIKPRGPSAGK